MTTTASTLSHFLLACDTSSREPPREHGSQSLRPKLGPTVMQTPAPQVPPLTQALSPDGTRLHVAWERVHKLGIFSYPALRPVRRIATQAWTQLQLLPDSSVGERRTVPAPALNRSR